MSADRHPDRLRGCTLRFTVTGALVGLGATTLGCAQPLTNPGPQPEPAHVNEGPQPEATPTTPVGDTADTSEPETKPEPEAEPETNTGPQQKPKVIANPGPQPEPPPKSAG